MNKKIILKKIKQFIMIAIGVILLDTAFYFIMDPANIVIGGMMGLSILLQPLYSKVGAWFTPSIFLFIGNTITLIVGGILLGKDFFAKTVFSSLFSPLVVFVYEQFCSPRFFLGSFSPAGYYIVALVCGTLLAGIGIGLAIKNNGCTGGMDVVQRILSKYMHVPHSLTMYFTDWVIVILSGFILTSSYVFNIELVLYGSIGVLGVSKIIDTLVLNAKSRRTAYIITNKPDEVKNMIYETIDRGVTCVDVYGGYTGDKKTMIICAMDKNQAYKVNEILKRDFPDSFSFLSATREVLGAYDEHKYEENNKLN